MKGKYYVELYDGGKRRSLCLRTDNYELACQRYAAGLQKLRKKIRAEHEAAKSQERLAWLPSEPATVWDVPVSMELTVENLEKYGRAHETTADQVLPDEQLRDLTWDDLVENARTVRRRYNGKDYGKAWLKNTRTILSTVDFKPAGLTPQRIRRWLDEQEKRGISAVTMKNRASALQGLIEKAIKYGYQPQLAPNPSSRWPSPSARRWRRRTITAAQRLLSTASCSTSYCLSSLSGSDWALSYSPSPGAAYPRPPISHQALSLDGWTWMGRRVAGG